MAFAATENAKVCTSVRIKYFAVDTTPPEGGRGKGSWEDREEDREEDRDNNPDEAAPCPGSPEALSGPLPAAVFGSLTGGTILPRLALPVGIPP
jgi:hypothetical protein